MNSLNIQSSTWRSFDITWRRMNVRLCK